MVSDVTMTGVAIDAQKTDQQQVKLAEDFNQFLSLLTTQLQNQDPMDPMKSKEFTNQLVQFSQVEQSINTNQKLDNLVNLQMSNMTSAALGYVGMDIKYQSADMNFDGETPVDISYSLPKEAASARANIYDERGQLVYTQDVPRDVGGHTFGWDGSHTGGGFVEPGTYNVQISAFDGKDELIETKTVVSGHVRGVESQDGLPFLLVGDRAVSIDTVISATRDATSTTNAPNTEDSGNGETTTDQGGTA